MESIISREEARVAFQNLVASGLIPLYVRYDSWDISSRRRQHFLPVNTPKEFETANLVCSYETPVCMINGLDSGWKFYPRDSELDEFAPTIARLRE